MEPGPGPGQGATASVAQAVSKIAPEETASTRTAPAWPRRRPSRQSRGLPQAMHRSSTDHAGP
eukprot:8744172-Alexandrium_andersonii.AAC.1